MPDETNSLNSTNDSAASIPVPAQLEAVKTEATGLERDLAQANQANTTYHECAILLHDIHDAIAKFQQSTGTNPPAAPTSDGVNAPAIDLAMPQLPATNDVAFSPSVQINAPPESIVSVTPANAATPQIPTTANPPDASEPVSDHEPVTFPWSGGPSGSRTDLLQTSAEQVSRAFELNTQGQLSLHERMLELLDQQNRKLAELDRKTSELTNQIKSLKNP